MTYVAQHLVRGSGIRRYTSCAAALFVLGLLPGCGERVEEDARESRQDADVNAANDVASGVIHYRFTDVTAETGIDMIMTCGEMPATELLEVNGGGLALIDIDNSGRLDLFVANGATLHDPERGPGWRLFRNLGDMQFVDITEESGITHTRWAMGTCVGDFTGNGYDDIYVTCYGPNVLLRNNGDGTFTDVTADAGVGDERWGTTCAFGDVTGDGWLDLYVTNYIVFDHLDPPPRAEHKGVEVMGGPHGIDAEHDVLYRNNRDGTFTDITEAAGCLPAHAAYGLNCAILDFTGDGRQDIYVGNDSTPNFLFVNQGDGTFQERGRRMGIASNVDGFNQATMGVAIGDVTGNGLPDVFTTNFSSDTNTLHVNIDGEFFEDQTARWGLGIVSRPFLGWTAAFYDLNHDGREELFMVNGHIYPQATMELMDSEYEQPPLLFRRAGDRFERVTDPAVGDWLFTPRRDRPAVFGDLDGDGDIDMIIGEINGPVRVLRNDGADGPWLIVRLVDGRNEISNHRGLGSRVQADDGEMVRTRWIFSGASYQSSSAPEAHFGFPRGTRTVNLTIRWPDGTDQHLEDVAANQHLTVHRTN